MLRQTTIPWIPPLDLAAAVPAEETCWALLYSGLRFPFTGRYSYLALKPVQEIRAKEFTPLAKVLSHDQPPLANAWFGYLGYSLKNTLESLPVDKPSFISLPPLWMVRFSLILQFDHDQNTITVHAAGDAELQFLETLQQRAAPPGIIAPPAILSLGANMTKDDYLHYVQTIRGAIARGDFYQANLTRKFFGELATPFTPFSLFCRLARVSPAPYSAFVKLHDYTLLSSSPEQFLTLNQQGRVESRPIKGSAPRDAENAEQERANLQISEKDRAENLMIVDLMRNDLARHAAVGSVKVESLFDVTSYATLHHMSSTITAQKHPQASTLDLVKGCFPPGSMTGAPKIKAMEICSLLEQQERGVYSGVLGWFGGDGSCDLSVVIRTLILRQNRFEFQVGGGIVYDSDPLKEWQETLTKARGIASTLRIAGEHLERL